MSEFTMLPAKKKERDSAASVQVGRRDVSTCKPSTEGQAVMALQTWMKQAAAVGTSGRKPSKRTVTAHRGGEQREDPESEEKVKMEAGKARLLFRTLGDEAEQKARIKTEPRCPGLLLSGACVAVTGTSHRSPFQPRPA